MVRRSRHHTSFVFWTRCFRKMLGSRATLSTVFVRTHVETIGVNGNKIFKAIHSARQRRQSRSTRLAFLWLVKREWKWEGKMSSDVTGGYFLREDTHLSSRYTMNITAGTVKSPTGYADIVAAATPIRSKDNAIALLINYRICISNISISI